MERLRYISLLDGEYRLALWDTGRTSCNVGSRPTHYVLAFALWHKGELLFHSADLGHPMLSDEAIDSDWSIKQVLGWVSLRPGDTDPEYFDGYTPAQLEWCDGPGPDDLSWMVDDEDLEYTELELY